MYAKVKWFYGLAILVFMLGLLISAWIFTNSGVTKFPEMISNAYSEEQYRLNVPGSKDVQLTRTGAYGIYYEYNQATVPENQPNIPPAIDCMLTSKSTGIELEAAPDYIETNRYWQKEGDNTGVLIMSVTVHEPDTYQFACQYQNGYKGPEITVALGPNYIWEFLGSVWKAGLPLLGGICILCGSVLVALTGLIAGVTIQLSGRRKQSG